MNLDRQDSIVRITSNAPEIDAYGTGFIIYQHGLCSYVLTCAHVVNKVGGVDKVTVDDNLSAEVLALGSKGGIDGIDLAVLCIQGLQDKIPLNLRGYGKRGNRFVAPGYFSRKVGGEVEIVFKPVRGTLGENIGVGKDLPHLVNAWDLLIDNNYQLEPGYSGSPIIDEASNCVVGVACRKEGDKKGMAISIEALITILPEIPSTLSELLNASNQIVINSPLPSTQLAHYAQDLQDFISEIPNMLQDLEFISDSLDTYILQPDCEGICDILKDIYTSFSAFSTTIRKFNDLEVISIPQRFLLMGALSDFNEQSKSLLENLGQFCDQYGVMLEEDQPIDKRQALQKGLILLMGMCGNILEAARGLFEELSRKLI